MARFALFACGAALVSADKIKLGQDVDYPPYAFIDGAGVLQGFGKDIADGMTASCDDIEIEVVRANWSDCWDGNGPKLGAKLEDGTLDACTTYTHTKGVRNDWADFSGGILDVNKAAGLLTLLVDGQPKVNGNSDLDGVTIVDVAGWAPTADTIAFVENKCASKLYSAKYIMKAGAGNDAAMKMLRDGDADCMFVYADQAHNYQCNAEGKGKYSGSVATWDCATWKGFGTDYAYVQTGQFGYVFNGTTLALAKKGSGVAEKLNPCLWKFLETKEYYDICVKHDFVDHCYHNKHFPPISEEVHHEYNKPTNEHSGDCSSGYCPCPGNSESETSGAAGLMMSGFMALPIVAVL